MPDDFESDELPTPFDDDEVTPSGAHLVFADGSVVELPVVVTSTPPARSDMPEPEAKTSKKAAPSPYKALVVPIITAAVTAFIAAGGAITIGGNADKADHEEHAHLSKVDVAALNLEIDDLRKENASLSAMMKAHEERGGHDKADQAIRALELQQRELSVMLNFHLGNHK